jgi:hypothetical protein
MIPPRYPVWIHPSGCECPSCRRMRGLPPIEDNASKTRENCNGRWLAAVFVLVELTLSVCAVIAIFSESIYGSIIFGVALVCAPLLLWWHSALRRKGDDEC